MEELKGLKLNMGFRGDVDMMDLLPAIPPKPKLPPPSSTPKSDSAQEHEEVSNLTLHQCARIGAVERAEILIRNMGSNPILVKQKINVLDEDHLTPLHYAARHNHLGVLKLLVENQADITAVDEEGLTPLHYLSRFRPDKKKKMNLDQNDLDQNKMPANKPMEDLSSAISFLIEKGADINVGDNIGQTPLHFAAMRGNDVAARKLLELGKNKGIDIEASDKHGMTPLQMAASHSYLNIVKMLIRYGAFLQCKDKEDITPLHAACTEGVITIVKELFNAGNDQKGWVTIQSMVSDKDENGNTCLSLAVGNGHYEVVKLCLEKRADVNMPNSLNMYPLHLAAVNGDVKIVKLLIEHNACIDALNKEQATPLHKACQYNRVQVVRFLVDNGADIERRDKEKYTPLLLASVYGHVATVLLLIQKEADTNAVDKNGKTAIFLAAAENQVSCLEALVQNENTLAMINVSDRYDNDPLHIAAKKGYPQVVKFLLNNGAKNINRKNEEEQTPCHLAAKYGRTNIVRELVEDNKNAVNDQDKSSNTALHLAALRGHAKVAGVLIEMGADIAAKNEKLWTPLHCAAAKGWMKIARVLLEADSPIDPMDKAGNTPLHLAAMFEHAEVVELLIDWKADVKLRDSQHNNCLDLAIDNNNREAAVSIIKSNYWQEALRNYTLDKNTRCHDTPMRKLIRKMPDVAEDVFNRCMDGNKENIKSVDYKIIFNYEFLDDVYSILNWKGSSDSGSSSGSRYDQEDHLRESAKPYTTNPWTFKKNHPLMIMVTAKREDLLAHPLVTALLRYKWRSFGRKLYYLNFFLYAIFLLFITGYIVSTTPPYLEDARIAALNYSTYCEKLDADGYDQPLFANIGKYFIGVLAVWNMFREFVQIYQAKLNYLSLENLIEWVVYITSLLFVIDFNDCQKDTGYRYPWQWNVGTVAIFLSWINLVLFSQKFPKFGIYVVMFNDVLKTFIQFFLVFMLFIIAFALAFYALLQNQDSFSTVWQSLIKTTVMMIGEFDYDSIYTDGTVNYKFISYLMFCVFMVIMSIIIMNLLVGLAVDNIKEVQEQAVLTRKAMQFFTFIHPFHMQLFSSPVHKVLKVELVLNIERVTLNMERVVPDCFRRKHVTQKETIAPNDSVGCIKQIFGLESYELAAETISKALNPELDEMKSLKNAISQVRYNVKEIKGQMNNLEGMLKAMYEHSKGVEWQEEDDQVTEGIGPM